MGSTKEDLFPSEEQVDLVRTPLQEELKSLTTRELHERAEADGVDKALVEQAYDEEDTKATLVSHILEKAYSQDTDKLLALKKLELRQRAKDFDVPAQDIAAAKVEDNEKEVLVRMIIERADADCRTLWPPSSPTANPAQQAQQVPNPAATVDKDAGGHLWIESHPEFEFNGLYEKVSKGKESPLFKKTSSDNPKDHKYCYRCEAKGALRRQVGNRHRWLLNDEHTPGLDSHKAFIDIPPRDGLRPGCGCCRAGWASPR